MTLLPLVLLSAVAVFAFRHIEQQQREVIRLASETTRLEQDLRTRERVMTELNLLERSSDHEALLVQSPTPALAGAKLQGLISQLVEESGGMVDIIQILDPKDAVPFVEIAIRVEAEVSMRGLRQLLHAIETGQPLFAVDKLAVAPLYTRTGRQGDWVDFKADISAFTWSAPE